MTATAHPLPSACASAASPAHAAQGVVLLDFDGTVTNKDSLFAALFTLWLHDKSVLKALRVLGLLFIAALGFINKQHAKERLLSLFVIHCSPEEIQERLSPLISDLVQSCSCGTGRAHTHTHTHTHTQHSRF